MIQPEMGMDLEVVKKAMGWYYQLVRSVFIQSPQMSFVDVCLGDELISQSFKEVCTGISPRLQCCVSPVCQTSYTRSACGSGSCYC